MTITYFAVDDNPFEKSNVLFCNFTHNEESVVFYQFNCGWIARHAYRTQVISYPNPTTIKLICTHPNPHPHPCTTTHHSHPSIATCPSTQTDPHALTRISRTTPPPTEPYLRTIKHTPTLVPTLHHTHPYVQPYHTHLNPRPHTRTHQHTQSHLGYRHC